jgi:hypothetical protein
MILLLLFSGTEVSNSEQTKMVSAAEPAPANDEHTQGTPHHTHSSSHMARFVAQIKSRTLLLLIFRRSLVPIADIMHIFALLFSYRGW